MTPSVYTRPPWTPRLLTAAAVLMLMTSLPVSAMDQETCYSRQHQGVTVNVRMAMSRQGTASDVRVVRSERDCVLACCSEEVKPGARCNMAVFNAKKHPNEDNCYLFHCPTEQDCPLMKAQEGINTYDIYKGLIHPTTIRPVTTTTATTTTTTTTTEQTTTTTTPAPTTTTTTEPPTTTTTTTTTTQSTTTMAPTTAIITTTTPPTTTTTAPPPIIIIATMPAITMAPTTTTTTTTATAPATSTISTKKANKTSKKQNKTTKKAKPHPVNITTSARAAPSSTVSLPVLMADNEKAELRTAVKLQPDIEVPSTTTTTTATPTTTTTTTTTTQSPTTTPTTTTTTSTTPATTTTTTTSTTTTPTTTATTTTTTSTPSTTTTTPYTPPTTTTTTTPLPTTTTTEPPSTRTSPAASLLIVPKGAVQSDHGLQDQSRAKVAAAGRGAVKSGMVAFMVLGLAVLTLALAVGGRKAMESFDRRHYTRLELNDLHYEV